MTIELPKIILPIIFVIIAGIILNNVHIFNGLVFSEALKDPKSMLSATSLPLMIWAGMRLPISTRVFGYIILPLILIWMYFSYQYLSHSDYTPLNVPQDIAYGWHWVLNHKMIIAIAVVIMGFRYAIGRSVSVLSKGSHNDQN